MCAFCVRFVCSNARKRGRQALGQITNETHARVKDALTQKFFFGASVCASPQKFLPLWEVFFGRLGSDRDLSFFDPFWGRERFGARVKQLKIIEPRREGLE